MTKSVDYGASRDCLQGKRKFICVETRHTDRRARSACNKGCPVWWNPGSECLNRAHRTIDDSEAAKEGMFQFIKLHTSKHM
jgi:hypothetical protein